MRRTVTLALALSMLLLVGCAGNGQPAVPETPAAPAQTPQTQTPATPENEPQPPQDDKIHVSSVEELLEAIAPGAEIIVEPGRYDLTEFLQDYPNVRDQIEWTEGHPYVQLGSVYDGVEVTVMDVDGLIIAGGGDSAAETEIVTSPRYAAVLNFENCTDIRLSCLTMGHTEVGDCSGNVLDFERCEDILLLDMDLYGCGVYGIHANGCGDLYVANSVIHDCEYAPFDLINGTGDVLVTGCTFSGSCWGGNYEPNRLSRLAFNACVFGEGESNGWYFRNDVEFRNCEWSEITSYPDRDCSLDESHGFYPEKMTQLPFEDMLLGDTNWIGYAVVDPQSGETEYPGLMGQDALPSLLAFLELKPDGTGLLLIGEEEVSQLTWERMDGDMTLCLSCSERSLYLTHYYLRSSDGEGGRTWLMMQRDNDVIWFY